MGYADSRVQLTRAGVRLNSILRAVTRHAGNGAGESALGHRDLRSDWAGRRTDRSVSDARSHIRQSGGIGRADGADARLSIRSGNVQVGRADVHPAVGLDHVAPPLVLFRSAGAGTEKVPQVLLGLVEALRILGE